MWRKAGGKALVILPASVASALLMVLAAGTESQYWLAWIGLLPLFFLIRILPPVWAALSGTVWGISIYLLSIAGLGYDLTPSPLFLSMMALIPGLFALLCSWLTRKLGFNPMILAFGWILLEVSLRPLGLEHGLLTGMHGEGTHLHWMCRIFGCLSGAFVIACTNATILVLVVLSATLFVGILRRKSWAGIPDCHAALLLQSSFCLQHMEARPGSPRAPPIMYDASLFFRQIINQYAHELSSLEHT
jgi:apolipoprotein N-acyltransferase